MEVFIESAESKIWLDVGASILGLNKTYIEKCRGEEQYKASERHLRKFATDFIGRTESNPDDIVAFMGLIAGAYEDEKIPDDCEFNLSCWKKLCNLQ